MNTQNNNIIIQYDSETGDHYIIWEPIVVSAGKTKSEALEDLRAAAHIGADTLIDDALKNINKEK